PVRLWADHLEIVRHPASAHGEGDQCIGRTGGVRSTRGGAHSGELLDGGDRLGQVGPGQDHVVQLGGDGCGCGHLRFRSSTAGGRVRTRLAYWNTGVSVFLPRNRVRTGGGPQAGGAGNSGQGAGGTRSPTRTGSPGSANAAHACSRRESSVSTSVTTRANPIAESTMARLPSAVRVESARSREWPGISTSPIATVGWIVGTTWLTLPMSIDPAPACSLTGSTSRSSARFWA